MEVSRLKPFLREGLDILFIGLNPAIISNQKGHYFSVKSSFWDQLYDSGLITEKLNKDTADQIVFGSNRINRNQWSFGITDLISSVAESDSRRIKPTLFDCEGIINDIQENNPQVVTLMHYKVRDTLAKFLKISMFNKYGQLGKWVKGCRAEFFCVPFPHGNSIPDYKKISIYQDISNYLSIR